LVDQKEQNGRGLHHLETDKMRKEWAYTTNEVEAMIDISRKA
jgi:hypothetical protein